MKDVIEKPVDGIVLRRSWVPWLTKRAITELVSQAAAQGVPIVIINGPMIVQSAVGGGASNVAFGDHISTS